MIEDDVLDTHSYFIPMVDMLAGVVFILVILLASVTLVSREDYSEAQAAQEEISDIEARLQAARALDRTVLEPRRNAEAALRHLIERLQATLADQGIATEADASAGRLVVSGPPVFAEAGVGLSATGSRAAAAIADALASELVCLSPPATPAPVSAPDCASYPPARLDRAVIAAESAAPTVGDPAADRGEARALGLLSSVVGRAPQLMALRSADGEAILAYRGYRREAQAVPAQALGGTTERMAQPATEDFPRIVLFFQMDVPPLPPR